LPILSRSICPPVAEELRRDPSKLILTNSEDGGSHLTRWGDVEEEEGAPFECVHPTCKFRFSIQHMPFLLWLGILVGWNFFSPSKTVAFLSFQMLQTRKENFWSNFGFREDLTLFSASAISWHPQGENWIGNHWWLAASSYTFWTTWHSLKSCSLDSMSPSQVGHTGSMFKPLLMRLPLMGITFW